MTLILECVPKLLDRISLHSTAPVLIELRHSVMVYPVYFAPKVVLRDRLLDENCVNL